MADPRATYLMEREQQERHFFERSRLRWRSNYYGSQIQEKERSPLRPPPSDFHSDYSPYPVTARVHDEQDYVWLRRENSEMELEVNTGRYEYEEQLDESEEIDEVLFDEEDDRERLQKFHNCPWLPRGLQSLAHRNQALLGKRRQI